MCTPCCVVLVELGGDHRARLVVRHERADEAAWRAVRAMLAIVSSSRLSGVIVPGIDRVGAKALFGDLVDERVRRPQRRHAAARRHWAGTSPPASRRRAVSGRPGSRPCRCVRAPRPSAGSRRSGRRGRCLKVSMYSWPIGICLSKPASMRNCTAKKPMTTVSSCERRRARWRGGETASSRGAEGRAPASRARRPGAMWRLARAQGARRSSSAQAMAHAAQRQRGRSRPLAAQRGEVRRIRSCARARHRRSRGRHRAGRSDEEPPQNVA